MSDWNAVSAFMACVLPWPASPQDAGYCNLHFSTKDRQNPTGPLRKGGGWPFRSVDSFVSRASWLGTTDQFKDAWFCLSLQKETKPNRHNPAKPRAHRLAANALKVKALWADVDVGTKPGEYPTIELALKAVIQFRERHGLPPFSAIVGSGGGIQIYWISNTAMTVKEWAPYAEGLRALMIQDKLCKDPGVTCDVARILRVPGTFNHKYDPPKPVQLLNVPLVMYDFETALAVLPTVAPAATTVQVDKSPEHSVFVDEGAAALFLAGPAVKIEGDMAALQGGIDKHDEILLDPKPIFKQCGFYREALLTGGRDYDNALWMYSVLGATFMENGNAIAHAISKGHPTYSADATQALYDRKVADRADRGIGYPSCATIAGAGCQACQTCPLFPKGKSPLNIRPVVTAAVNHLNMALPQQQSQTAQDLNLPLGYDVDADGRICEVIENIVDGERLEPTMLQLFWSKLSNPWAQSSPECLNFTTTVDLGTTYDASIRHEDMNAISLYTAFNKNRVKIFPKNKARLEHFMVSWLNKLHEIKASQRALPYGWYIEDGNTKGFAFGGRLFKDDGSEISCGVGDVSMRSTFHASGDIQHWRDAMKTVTDQQRPELEAIVALSFSSPLMYLAGKNAVTMCAYGESGAGKSAAYSVGIGVWGHSKRGKQVSHSTFNGVMKTLGELNNLPMYWDEIKDAKAQMSVYDFIYNASDGVEKSRLRADTSMQHRGTWQTQMMCAANISLIDFIMSKDKEHVAGVSRVLEYHVKKPAPNAPGRIGEALADTIIDKLTYSYGQMGLLYSKLLALNHVSIKEQVLASCQMVENDMAATAEERLWVTLVGTLLVGARLANTLDAGFNEPALKSFLYDVYTRNRAKRDALISLGGTKETMEATLSAYLAQIDAKDQAIWTKGMPVAAGTPRGVSILHGPKDMKNVAVTQAIVVRWDTEGQTLYILRDHFKDWLNETGRQFGTTLQGLTDEYGMETRRKIRIGAGAFVSGRQTLIAIPNIDGDHDLAELMYKWSPASERPQPSAPAHPYTENHTEFVQTGIEDAAG